MGTQGAKEKTSGGAERSVRNGKNENLLQKELEMEKYDISGEWLDC